MTSKKRRPPEQKPHVSRFPERRGGRKPLRPGAPALTVSFVSIDVYHNGWPGETAQETDVSLILQLENPGSSGDARVVASERLPFRARPGSVIGAFDLGGETLGRPFFRGPVTVSDHVNLHVRFFIERSNAVGPLVGAALTSVVGEVTRRIPLLPEPPREALHIQIGKAIATELARANVIVPVEASAAGKHPVALALVAPRTTPGVYVPPASTKAAEKLLAAQEGDLMALLSLELELSLPGATPQPAA